MIVCDTSMTTIENIVIMARSTSFYYIAMKMVGLLTTTLSSHHYCVNGSAASGSNGRRYQSILSQKLSSRIMHQNGGDKYSSRNKNHVLSTLGTKWLVDNIKRHNIPSSSNNVGHRLTPTERSPLIHSVLRKWKNNIPKIGLLGWRERGEDTHMASSSSPIVSPIVWKDQFIRKLQDQLDQISERATEQRKQLLSKLRIPTTRLQISRKGRAASPDQVRQRTDEVDVVGSDECNNNSIINSLSQPLIDESIWDQLDGTEFQKYPVIWNHLANVGKEIATHDESNEWIDWNLFSNPNDIVNKPVEDGNSIHVWTGKCLKPNTRGHHLPWIKTRSLIPFTPQEMVDLLLDSNRVKSYNQWSLGRKDCWVATSMIPIMESDDNHDSNNKLSLPLSSTLTKIVKNRVQPPLGAKQMVSTTLLHAQRCDKNHQNVNSNDMVSKESIHDTNSNNNNKETWIVVSRAVGGKAFYEPEYDEDVGTSEMLLGVNVIQPYDEQHSILTAVTHVYSSAVPTLLAERVGVKSAIKFVNDLRSLKENMNSINNNNEKKMLTKPLTATIDNRHHTHDPFPEDHGTTSSTSPLYVTKRCFTKKKNPSAEKGFGVAS
jgi:hypothetical protein